MIIFALGLAALGFVALRHRRRRWYAYHHGWHGHPGCHHHDHDHGGLGWRRGGPYHLMRMLDTTPGQERVIREEVDAVRGRARAARDELHAARADLAEVVRAEPFDRARFDAALARVDAAWDGVKGQLGDSVGKIHGTLDARQRERLADLLASRRGPSFGPFR